MANIRAQCISVLIHSPSRAAVLNLESACDSDESILGVLQMVGHMERTGRSRWSGESEKGPNFESSQEDVAFIWVVSYLFDPHGSKCKKEHICI